MAIGIVGVGVVGVAVLRAFATTTSVIGYDIKGEYAGEEKWNRILTETDLVFICVPSPTIDGEQDLTALEDVLKRLKADCYQGVVCIKCTVLPGTCENMRQIYGLRICHNPEFLTAAKPYEDFMNQKAVIIGGQDDDAAVVAKAYHELFYRIPCYVYSTVVTELAKYMRNNFLALKVAFANEYYAMCQHLNCDYNTVKDAMLSQEGIEPKHFAVPGPDGKLGYSGACFPKDIRALVTFLKENDLNCSVLEAVDISNQKVRPHDLFCREIGGEDIPCM